MNGLPRHVYLISPYFAPERIGIAPYALDIATDFSKLGIAVDVITTIPHYPRKPKVFEVRCESKFPFSVKRIFVFERINGGIFKRVLNDILFFFGVFRTLLRRNEKQSPSIVIVPSVLSIFALRLAGQVGPIVAAVYDVESELADKVGLTSNKLLLKLMRWVERRCLSWADNILAITPEMASGLRSLSVETPISVVELWPSGVSNGRSSDFSPNRKHKILMYSGGLCLRHGIEIIPEIWKEVIKDHPDARLVIQGDGPEKDFLEKQLDKIGGDFILRPAVSYEDLVSSLQEAALQLVLQRQGTESATLPSKALSSLGAGVPFVTNAQRNSPLAKLAIRSKAGIYPCSHETSIGQLVSSLLSSPANLQELQVAAHEFSQMNCLRRDGIESYIAILSEKIDG